MTKKLSLTTQPAWAIFFIYDYNDQLEEDQPLSGGSDRWCNNLETTLVP